MILQTCLLVGCSTVLQQKLGADSAPDATTSAIRNAHFSARSPTTAERAGDRQSPASSRPLLFPGSEPETPPSRSRDSDYGVRTTSLEPVTGDDVELNFEGADVASAAKAILGGVLHFNFAVDPRVQGPRVILKVLPHVNENATIELEVDQGISAVVNPQQQTLTPTISDRHVHSTVAVSSGQTVLLGGLISDNDQRTKNGLPIVGDIKVLGDLLGNTDNTNTRTEIIIFIRPRVIRHSIDARAVTEEFRDKLTTMKNGANSIVSGADISRR